MTQTPSDFTSVLRLRAEEAPDHLAVRDETGSLTYRELVDDLDRRVEALRASGVGEGSRVALVADNSAAYLATAAAVWACKAVLVTIYPSSGAGELRYCLESSDPALVVASERVLDTVRSAARGFSVVSLDADELPTARESTHVHDGIVSDLALICFTSGSTARPKAVMHTASGLLAAAHAFGKTWHMSALDRTVVCLPMAWAFGLVTTSMTTLIAGGTVLSLSRTRPELVHAAIERDAATVLAGVTTMFTKLVEHFEQVGAPKAHHLRLCVSGGEPRNEEVFSRWTAIMGIPVFDNYAASECFPVITYDPAIDPAPVPRSAGKVVDGAAMLIVDRDGKPLDPGVQGEALWRGPAMFVGYWGDPEQTAKALTPEGWYRTNDLVRLDEDGYVFVEGRLSDMIIRGGSNVSPSEVESVIRQHPAVAAATVVGLPDPRFGQRVVAVIVPAAVPLPEDEVLQLCREHLAGYKVPTELVVVDELPTNHATGKVNRRELASSLSQD